MAKPRLEELYTQKIRPELMKELGYKNIMQVPRLEKIVVNVGSKEAVSDSRVLKKIADVLIRITGQTPVRTTAKKSIAGFKIREGMPLGSKVTLRRKHMYEFLDRLISLALPKVKDFQGLKPRFDRSGNYNLGLKEWTVFPEADGGVEELSTGLNITFQTTASTDQEAYTLLKNFGMPYRQKK